MMIKKVLLCVCLCCALVVGLACPAFATDGELDYQYVFSKDFTFSDIVQVEGTDWYYIPFDISAVAEKVSADYVIFAIDDYEYQCQFMSFSRGKTYHYIGTPSDVFGVYDGSDYPFCLALCQDDTTLSRLYLHSELVGPLYHGDSVTMHIAVSVPVYEPDNATVSITDGVTGVIGFAGHVVSALVNPDGALSGLLPVVGMAVGLGVVVWGIKRFKSCAWGF